MIVVVCTISMIAGISSMLTFVYDWGGVCVDAFKVYSTGAQFGEWIAVVPLLVYSAIAIQEKTNFSSNDIGAIMSTIASMVSMIPLQTHTPFWASCLFLATPIGFMSLTAYFLLIGSRYRTIDVAYELDDYDTLNRSMWMRRRLLWVLCCMFPLFPLVYFLAVARVIDADWTVLWFSVCDVSTKILFASVALDVHNDAVHDDLMEQVLYANESRSRYLRFVMHEVRVPLGSVTMGLGVLRKNPYIRDAEGETLLMMDESSAYMSSTLNSVLDMEKIEAGKLELVLSVWSPRSLVVKLCNTVRGAAAAKNIRLRTDIMSQVPNMVKGDAVRIEHVLANLASNAIKFSPVSSEVVISVDKVEGHVPVSRSYTRTSIAIGRSRSSVLSAVTQPLETNSNTVALMFSVKDQGPGMSAEDRVKLFKPFSQIRPEEQQKGGGTGIGLNLCKQLVELHKGSIACTSVINEGSTFSFVIPFELPSEEEARVAAMDELRKQLAQEESISLSIQEGLRALVADDTGSNRKLLGRLLEYESVDAQLVSDGLQAVLAVEENLEAFDFIMMDNMMPVMSGVEAVDCIRKLGYTKWIIGVSGNALEDDIELFLSAGVDLVLAKPLTDMHVRKLVRYIRRHGSRSEPDVKFSMTSEYVIQRRT